MAQRDTSVSELYTQLGLKPVTLYRYLGPQGQLREGGARRSSSPEPLSNVNRKSRAYPMSIITPPLSGCRKRPVTP